MQQVNKKILFNAITWVLVIICFAVGSIHWFSNIKPQNLNGDEPTWTAMTEMYQHRKNQNWSRFQLHQKLTRSGYGNERNILLDQPQASKYLFGFVLDITNSNPWTEQDISWIYRDFSKGEIPQDKSPHELTEYLGKPLTEAIENIRIFTTAIGWINLLLFSFIIYRYTRNLFTTSITFLLTSFNPLLLNYFRKAMTDGLSLFALMISGILIWIGISKLLQKKTSSLPILMLAGCSVAVTSSIKLNGLFLTIFPLWLLLSILITDQKIIIHFQKMLICMILFIIGFIFTVYALEPVTWNTPIAGVNGLLQARLIQQANFFSTFGKVNYINVPGFSLHIFFRDYPRYFVIPLFVTLMLGFTTLITQCLNKNMEKMKIFSVLLFIFATNFYYARTGFDRYLIPTIFCLFFINAIGLTFLFTKVKNYVISKI